MSVVVRPFVEGDYVGARRLWEQTEGVGLSAADEEAAILSYLARNPDMSQVAMDGDTLVGTILIGHDGRRGMIHHLAVAPSHRRRGLARLLLETGLAALGRAGIGKCHLFVFDANASGRAFWTAIGAEERENLVLFSLLS